MLKRSNELEAMRVENAGGGVGYCLYLKAHRTDCVIKLM